MRSDCKINSKHCIASYHLVLTDDLQWVPCREINTSHKLLAFDEYPAGRTHKGRFRRYRKTEVLAVEHCKGPVRQVELESGRLFTTTPDHRWLVDSGFGFHFVETQELRKGPRLFSSIVKLMDIFTADLSYGAGWLSGIMDGEGHIRPDGSIAITQRPGLVTEKIKCELRRLGYAFTAEPTGGAGLGQGDCLAVRVNGEWADRVRLLGQIRPIRLLNNFMPERHCLVGTMRDRVKTVRPIQDGDLTAIRTATGTLICEGYAMHDCNGLSLNGRKLEHYKSTETNQRQRPAWFPNDNSASRKYWT